MAHWYLIRNGQQHGPISDQQLQQYAVAGQIQPTDQVRRHDMPNPVLAGAIDGLFPKVVTASSQPAAGEPDRVMAVLWAALIVIGLLMLGRAAYNRIITGGVTKAVAEKNLPDLRTVPDDAFILSERLFAEYSGNEVGADQRYKGKTIAIVGEVADVERSPDGRFDPILDGTVINLRCPGNPHGVRCVLSDASAGSGDVAKISAGDMVKVRGYCYGKHLATWIVLGDCEFIVWER